MMQTADPKWRQFEKALQTIFARNPKARVHRDYETIGRSGEKRKLEVLVEYPFTIEFATMFAVEVLIKLAVDCKDYSKPVNINQVGQFADQMDDIGAPVGIMAAPCGFTKGAEGRAKLKNIFLVHATWDLMRLAQGLELPDFCVCSECESEREHVGEVHWEVPPRLGGTEFWPCVLRGICDRCSTLHVFCPDCGSVSGFTDADLEDCIECSGGCGRVYIAVWDGRNSVYQVSTMDHLDRAIVQTAFKNGRKLTELKLKRLIDRSKWQYFGERPCITEGLEGEGLVEWETIDNNRSRLVLTREGAEFCEKKLANARQSHYGV